MGIFDEMAHRYDTEERAAVAGVIAGEIRAYAKRAATKNAVDYGCGTGLVGLQLAGDFKSLVLMDASAAMVDVVRQKMQRARLQNASAMQADLTEGEPPDVQADCVFMAQVLLHIPNTRLILERLNTLLRPGGQLLIVDFDRNAQVESDKVHNGFEQATLARQVEETGFSRVSSHTFHHGSRMFMNQDASLFLMEAWK